MLLKKLKIALMVLLATGIVGTGVTGLAFQASAGDDPKAKAPVENKAGKLLVEPAGADADLRQLKAELERLRTELDALKKQVRPADAVPASDAKLEKLTIKVYSVKDLVREIDPRNPPTPNIPPIIRVITNTIQPNSWNVQGGTGSVEYFDVGQSLVISQTVEVHKEIEALLTELRSALPKGP